MSADNYLNPGGEWVDVKFMHVVEYVYVAPAQFDQFYHRQLCARAASVNVAAYRCYWSELAKVIEDERLPHIAGVKDVLDTTECFDCFGPQKAMSVGDDTDFHHPL